MSICTLGFREVWWYVQTLWIVRPLSPQFAVRDAATCIVSSNKRQQVHQLHGLPARWANELYGKLRWLEFPKLKVRPCPKRANAGGAINSVGLSFDVALNRIAVYFLFEVSSKHRRNTQLYKQDFLHQQVWSFRCKTTVLREDFERQFSPQKNFANLWRVANLALQAVTSLLESSTKKSLSISKIRLQ